MMHHNPRFSYLQAIPASIYSADLYRDVMHRWRGMGLGYVLLSVLISMAIISSVTTYRAYETIFYETTSEQSKARKLMYNVASQMPILTWRQDQLTMQEPGPYDVMHEIDADEFMPVIRFDMGFNVDAFLNSGALIMVGPKSVVVKGVDESSYEVHPYDIETINAILQGDGRIDSARVYAMSDEMLAWIAENKWSNIIIIALIFWVMFSILWLIIRTLMVLLFGLVMQATSIFLLKHTITYEMSVRLCAVALTPAIIIHTAMILINKDPLSGFMPSDGLSPWLFLLITLAFGLFGIAAVKAQDGHSSSSIT